MHHEKKILKNTKKYPINKCTIMLNLISPSLKDRKKKGIFFKLT